MRDTPPWIQMRYLMGTLVEIRIWEEPSEKAQAACREAFAEIRRLEAVFSRFDPESEIRRAAREACRRPLEISPDLLAVLSLAQDVSEASRGAFDITAGAWTRMWEAAQQTDRFPSPDEWRKARARVGWEKIQLDRSAGTLRLEQNDLVLDLGAVGKGYAVDRAVERLQQIGIGSGLVDAGGNFKIFGFSDPQSAGIENPLAPDHLWGTVDLIHPSISTSSNALRGFSIQGNRCGHVLDPRTGGCLENRAGATVLAESAAVADALSTALLVLGPGCMKLLQEYGAEAVFIGEPVWVSKGLQAQEALS